MRQGRGIVVLAVLAAGATACTGILGLDATTLRGADAGEGDGAGPDANSGADAPPPDSGADGTLDGATDAGHDSGSDATAPKDGAADGPALDAPVFTTNPTSITVAQDASAAVTVNLQRNGFLAGAVPVTFAQLPTGVTSTTGTIAADAGSTVVTVSASAAATTGSSTAALQAKGTTYASVPLDVVGASGSIDVSFGGGYVTDSTSGAVFHAVAVDPMGGVVAAGVVGSAGWFVRRYQSDGTSDTTFDANATAVMPGTGGVSAMAIDPTTGYIVLAGTGPGTQLTVLVLAPNGNAYGGFHGGLPYSSNPVFTQSSAAEGVAILPNQTFFAVGSSMQGSSVAAITAPLGESETSPPPDPFGSSGVSSNSTVYAAAAADSMGRLVAAGTANNGGLPNPLVGRYTPSGSVDGTFGDAGAPFVDTNSQCTIYGLAVRPAKGTIFVVGTDPIAGNLPGCFAQYDTTGSTVFSKLGTPGGGGPFAYRGAAAAGDAKDHVYMVGSGGDMYGQTAELDRVNADGSYDTTFGGTGQVELDPPGSPPPEVFTLYAVAVQADGRILVAGVRAPTMGGSAVAIVGRFWP